MAALQRDNMLSILLLAALLFKDTLSAIILLGSRTAEYGMDANYSCLIDNPTDVHQVSWKKKESREAMATFSNRFQEQVNEPYLGKVVFEKASLNSIAVTLKNMTWDDEGCYICSFNAYPEGSQRKQICLTVQGISEVKTQVISSEEEEDEEEDVEVVISCSATGRPAPTVQWIRPPDVKRFKESKTTIVGNSDRTDTSSSNITLWVPADWSGSVDCVLNKGVRVERIPLKVGDGNILENEKSVRQLSSSGVALVVLSVLFVVFIIVAVALKRNRLKSNKRSHNVV